MISFKAKIYNVTSGKEKTYGNVTIGQYVGPLNMGNLYGQDFKSTIQSFSINHANNLGRVIEEEAKYYYANHSVWPVLRIYVATKDSFYFEWSHRNKDAITVVTSDRRVLANALHFEDQNAWNSSIYSYIWTVASTISELNDMPQSSNFGWIYFGIPYAEISSSTPCNGHVTDVHFNVTFDSLYATQVDEKDMSLATSNLRSSSSQVLNRKLSYDLSCLACGIVYWDDTARQVGVAVQTCWPHGKYADYGQYYLDTNGSKETLNPATYRFTYERNGKKWDSWRHMYIYSNVSLRDVGYSFSVTHFSTEGYPSREDALERILSDSNADYDTDVFNIYQVLTAEVKPMPVEPDSDVDPDNPTDPYEPPAPIPPDDQDPYYDPSSDPDNPDYDPTKDPDSPSYDPSTPHTPYRPPSSGGGGNPPVQQPQDPVPVPDIPPAFVTNNSMFTLYNPSAGDLNSLAAFLWSPQWSIDTFKKIFANPLDCILGLMVMPHLAAPTSSKEMAVGNIATGVTMRYFTNQFYDFDCGTFKIEEFYASYLDYAPYTKVNIFLPYIGDQQLDTDEVMNKTIGVKYRFDIATGDCVAFISVDGDVLYSYSGNCASRLPLSGNNWSGMLPAFTGALVAAGSMAAGVPALGAGAALAVTSMKQSIAHTGSMAGSPGLMGIQTPYLIITRPRQALPIGQNSFTGYPSFMTESLGSLSGYTEVEACHLEHVPCTAEELEEIERLLKEGVLF